MRRALDAGFLAVAAAALAGVAATFAADLRMAVVRNRRPIGPLRPGGLGRVEAMPIPVTRALVIEAAGRVLSLLASGAMTGSLAASLGVEGSLARLGPAELPASGPPRSSSARRPPTGPPPPSPR